MNLRRHWKLVLLALWCLAVTFSSYHLLTPYSGAVASAIFIFWIVGNLLDLFDRK